MSAWLSFGSEDHEDGVAQVILVTGATGNAGREVARALAAAGHPVRALTRDPATARLPPGVAAVRGDLTAPDTLDGAFDDVSAVFLLAGYPDVPGLLARMADAEVRRVVLLSTGAVENGNLDNYVVRFNVVSEAAVRDSALTWTVLRPSGFMSNALRWLPQLRDGDTVREPFADLPVAVIDPFDIGAAAALALTEEEHAGRSYRLTGPQSLRPGERLDILGQVLGRDLRLEPQPDDEARQAMSAAMPAAMVDAFFEFSRGRTYLDDQVTGTTEALLGRPPRTFRDWAHAHAGEFSPA
jgi:uncharacterized protein YbjT (DUF2867 family)